jgi:hypothetical protein
VKDTQITRKLSRRSLFGLGAATAGVIAAGDAKAAFAQSGDDDRNHPTDPPAPGFGDVSSFTHSLSRVPGTELALRAASDFHASGSAVTLPTVGGVYSTTDGGFVETNLDIPGGSLIRRIDVFGRRGSAGDQIWAMQRYDPTNFGLGNATSLYLLTLTGSSDLSGTLPIPADGLQVPEGIKLGVYLRDTRVTNAAWGVACQYLPPPRGFRAIDPVRVYDSRAAVPAPGMLARNQNRAVYIADARDAAGNVVQPEVVPFDAVAVTFNVTATGTTGPNYLSVTPGYATSASTSTLNWPGGFDIANASTVRINPSRTVKVFMGDQSGSAHFIIDITGYYMDVRNVSL